MSSILTSIASRLFGSSGKTESSPQDCESPETARARRELFRRAATYTKDKWNPLNIVSHPSSPLLSCPSHPTLSYHTLHYD